MPLLVKAKKVTIFTFSARAERVARGLGHAGRSSPAPRRRRPDFRLDQHRRHFGAGSLFASLDTQDADLIVAGAFGHSRLFESLFGGVSLDLMRQPTAPILMSH